MRLQVKGRNVEVSEQTIVAVLLPSNWRSSKRPSERATAAGGERGTGDAAATIVGAGRSCPYWMTPSPLPMRRSGRAFAAFCDLLTSIDVFDFDDLARAGDEGTTHALARL